MNIENTDSLSHEVTGLERISNSATQLDATQLNEAIDCYDRNLREFGIKDCTDAAKEIFSPDVLENWADMSPEKRRELAQQYGDRVAESFQLENYSGVVFEVMEGKNGYNNGDGHAYLSETLINEQKSPLQTVDTITHELRHQYQNECIRGSHDIDDQTRLEWAKGEDMYTTDMPWAYDPWGYKYNPLEIDARFAGESVVRELTKDYINGEYS